MKKKTIIKVFLRVLMCVFILFILLVSMRVFYLQVYLKHIEPYRHYSHLVKEYQNDTTLMLNFEREKVIILDIKKLENNVKNGDTTAFNKLRIVYSNWGLSNDIIEYALIMANKYNYPPAYICVYEEIVKYNGGDIEKCPAQAKHLALAYLEQYKKLIGE